MTQTRIRSMTPSDVPVVVEACADWRELAQHGPPYWRPRATAELERKIAAMSGPTPATEYTFVIEADGRLLGECSLHAIDWRNRNAQVGICIWSPLDRGNGYGRRAVSELMAWAHDELGLLRLEAWILAGNGASRALFSRLGFTHEGTLVGRYRHGGRQHDVCVYGLVR